MGRRERKGEEVGYYFTIYSLSLKKGMPKKYLDAALVGAL